MKNNIFNSVLIFLAIAILIFMFTGHLFTKNSPTEVNIANKFEKPNETFPLGTDELGRCEFSRIMEGGKTTLFIVLLGSTIVFIVGTSFGLLVSMVKNKGKILVESILNAITSLPPIVYLIIFVGIWGNSIGTMLFALTITMNLRMIKLVKNLALIESQKAYILCQIASGASRLRLLFVHILPNIIFSIIKFICLSCSEMIITISGFSFIGLTLGDDIIDWGSMLSDARSYISREPMLVIYPILFIFLSSISFNYLGQKIGEYKWS